MLRWNNLAVLSQNIHLFSRLSRKVSHGIISLDGLIISPRVLIALIRNQGNRPCPCCLVPKTQLQNLGLKRDMALRTSQARIDNHRYRSKVASARAIIYDQKFAVQSQAVEDLLKEDSLVANQVSQDKPNWLVAHVFSQNAFSKCLADLGFILFIMLVMDILHEFELGVWKALFAHLVRILIAFNVSAVNKMDRRCGVLLINKLILAYWHESKVPSSSHFWPQHH